MPATMLLADDSSTIRRVIELTLANEDVRLVSVVDGESAILQIETDRPDIVLADVGMPKLDGYGVASHLKRSPALRDIPVLLLTGAFEPIDEARARASGCDGILVKPFDPQLLLARVKELLAGRPRGVAPPEGVFHATPEVLSPAASPARTPAVLPGAPAVVQDAARRLDVEARVDGVVDPGPVSLQTADDGGLELEFDQIEAAFAQRHQHEIPALSRSEIFIDEAPGMPAGGPGGSLDGLGVRDVPAPPAPPKAYGLERSQPASPTAVSALREPPAAPARNPRLLSRVSLADAFSALLAAEQAPAPSSTAGAPAISEAMVEELVRRVLTRMTEDAVHRFVAETAERVLREELDRLKKDPH